MFINCLFWESLKMKPFLKNQKIIAGVHSPEITFVPLKINGADDVFRIYDVDSMLKNFNLLEAVISGLLHNRDNQLSADQLVQFNLLQLKLMINQFKMSPELMNNRKVIDSLEKSALFIHHQFVGNDKECFKLLVELKADDPTSFLITSVGIKSNNHTVGCCLRKTLFGFVRTLINKGDKSGQPSYRGHYSSDTGRITDETGIKEFLDPEKSGFFPKSAVKDGSDQVVGNCGVIALANAFQFAWGTREKKPTDLTTPKKAFVGKYKVENLRNNRWIVGLMIKAASSNLLKEQIKSLTEMVEFSEISKKDRHKFKVFQKEGYKSVKTLVKSEIDYKKYFDLKPDGKTIISKLKQFNTSPFLTDYKSFICSEIIDDPDISVKKKGEIFKDFLEDADWRLISCKAFTNLIAKIPNKDKTSLLRTPGLGEMLVRLLKEGPDEVKEDIVWSISNLSFIPQIKEHLIKISGIGETLFSTLEQGTDKAKLDAAKALKNLGLSKN